MLSSSDSFSPPTAQPDLSVYLAYTPEKLLPFWYGQTLCMPLSIWQELHKQAALTQEMSEAPCRLWVQLIQEDLAASDELILMENTSYLNEIGPFYYLPDKVCFYFSRNANTETFGAEEFSQRKQDIEAVSSLDPLLQKSLSQRSKTTKRTALQPEELKKEIQICMLALSERDRFQRQAERLKDFGALCGAALSQAEEVSPKPELKQEMPKPEKGKDSNGKKGNFRQRLYDFFTESSVPASPFQGQQRRQYFLSLRLYENACDRYKEAREKWHDFHDDFYAKVETVEKACAGRQATVEKNIRLCNEALTRSSIHTIYQKILILESFLCYLETGRATNLQSCINLYEEEQHWNELKNSQHRIENTILSWQPEPGKLPILDSETMTFLQSIRSMLSKDA